MSVSKAAIAIALVLAATPALGEYHNVWGPEDASYAAVMKDYAREMVTAKISVKYCPGYNLKYNIEHFSKDAPPVLWDEKRHDEFVTREMEDQRDKINAVVARIGLPAYCAGYIDFIKENNKPNNLPVFIGSK